ncbi:hypothetical protein [Streptomyces sp. NPDC059909]|uniref:hypothetical protein n=1 Tax=Streptomyces sp. NPDC059909 TaxID=3346998 RepID=UPI00364DB962
MAEPTYHYCNWCQRTSPNAVAVRIVHANSGPGMTLYACPACRTIFRLRPLSEQAEA